MDGLRRHGRRILRYLFDIGRLGEGDVLLASFPKSGSTWVRFVLANLISLRFWDGRPLDFPTLDATLPELGVSRLGSPWPFRSLLPRVVKTHKPAWPILRSAPAVLLLRHPLDVMVSFYHHDRAQGGPRIGEASLAEFVRHPRFGLPGWVAHTVSWQRAGARVTRYEHLRSEPAIHFPAFFRALGFDPPWELVVEALERSSLQATRRAEERHGLDPAKGFDASFRFVRRGAIGEGRAVLDADSVRWASDYLQRHGLSQDG